MAMIETKSVEISKRGVLCVSVAWAVGREEEALMELARAYMRINVELERETEKEGL